MFHVASADRNWDGRDFLCQGIMFIVASVPVIKYITALSRFKKKSFKIYSKKKKSILCAKKKSKLNSCPSLFFGFTFPNYQDSTQFNTHTHAHAYKYIHMHIPALSLSLTHTHTYIYIYIHAHIYMHISGKTWK